MRKPLEYRNFDVSLDGDGNNRFKARVKYDPITDEMRDRDAPHLTYNAQQFWDDPSKKTGGYLGTLEQRRISEDDMYKLGRLLADMALPSGEVRNRLRANLKSLEKHQALRLRLFIDPVWLSHLPWEYMYLCSDVDETANEPGNFLALRPNISIVRTELLPGSRSNFLSLPVTRMVGILPDVIVADLPRLAVNEDKDAIDEMVTNLYPLTGEKTLKRVDWARSPTTVAVLKELLTEDAHIFHYSGHARFVQDTMSGQMKGQFLLEKENVEKKNDPYDLYSAEDLMRILAGKVYLVVLNACETGSRDGQRAWGGIAAGLVREQVPLVIANQFSIQDANARLLTKHLYENLLSGYTIDEALNIARDAIYSKRRFVEARDWGVPVLYIRNQAHATLFPPQQRKEENDFFHELQNHYEDLLTIQTRIEIASNPFINGNLIESSQHNRMLENIQQLQKMLKNTIDLLNTTGKAMLGPFPLKRLQLVATLEGVQQGQEKLWIHITDFPADGQARSTPKQRRLVLRDLESIQGHMRIALSTYQQTILPLRMQQITSITKLLHDSQGD